MAQGQPGTGSPPPHLPGLGRGEEAPGRERRPLLQAGVAQPVPQPPVEQVGLVCRGGDSAVGNRAGPMGSGCPGAQAFLENSSSRQSPTPPGTPNAHSDTTARPTAPPALAGARPGSASQTSREGRVPSWRVPGARLTTFDTTGRRGRRLGPLRLPALEDFEDTPAHAADLRSVPLQIKRRWATPGKG